MGHGVEVKRECGLSVEVDCEKCRVTTGSCRATRGGVVGGRGIRVGLTSAHANVTVKDEDQRSLEVAWRLFYLSGQCVGSREDLTIGDSWS